MRIAILYPNGALMVYAEDKPVDDVHRLCADYNHQVGRSHKTTAAKVVRVEVEMHGNVKL